MESFIHHTAVIYPNVKIKGKVYIGAYCIIGAPPEWKGHENDNKGVVIDDGTIICGLVTIDGGGLHPTYIGKECYIMKHSHIGHDAIIHDEVTISCGAKIGGHTIIGHNTNIGLNAVIHQKLKVPEFCMIGMGAVITKKTQMEPYSKYVGNPARYLSSNL
jgi:UDP-N-acetylglucosamine acyltransferase